MAWPSLSRVLLADRDARGRRLAGFLVERHARRRARLGRALLEVRGHGAEVERVLGPVGAVVLDLVAAGDLERARHLLPRLVGLAVDRGPARLVDARGDLDLR